MIKFECKECGALYSSEDILQVHLFAHTKYRKEYEQRLERNKPKDNLERNMLLFIIITGVVLFSILITYSFYDLTTTQQKLTNAVNSHNCQAIKKFGEDMLTKGNSIMSDQATNAYNLEGCNR